MSLTPEKIILGIKVAASDMGFGTNAFISGSGLIGKTLRLYSDRTWDVITKKDKLVATGSSSEIIGTKKVSDGLEITFQTNDRKKWLRTNESGGALPWMGNKSAMEALDGLLDYWRLGDHSMIIQEQIPVSSPVKYLGGTGASLDSGSLGTLWITPTGFALKSDEKFWHRSLRELLGVQIGGRGIYTTGGGWVGGGAGFNGAMQGAAMASMLNALETRVHNDCLMRLSFENAELNFQILDITPSNLELKLAPIRLHLERNLGVTSSSTMGLSGTVGVGRKVVEKDLKIRLQELKSAFEEGLVTAEEYEVKRALILEDL